MPRAATKTTAKKSSSTGVLALARNASVKALKKDDWRVNVDSEQLTESLPHIPTGCLVLDHLIGGELNRHGVRPCPGIPRARIAQVWGHESSGKTTLALEICAQNARSGGTCLYVDWEHALVPDYADALGVPITDPDLFEFVQPDTLEDGIKLAMIYAMAGVDLIIFDSIGAAVPARIANRDLAEVGEQARVGELQAVWSQELPNLRKAIAKKGAAILGISQIRAKINSGPANRGPSTQPQGGNAWKFYSDIRMDLRRIKQEKENVYNALVDKKAERITGGCIRAKMEKCKLAPSAGREELFYIRWGTGIDDMRSVMEIAIAHGVIKKGGAWLSWNAPEGPIKKQGVSQFRAYLEETPEALQALYNEVIPHLGSRSFKEEDLEDLEGLVVDDDDEDADALLAEVAEIGGGKKSSDSESEDDGESGDDGDDFDEVE
jgi:recombination protein RecA